MQSGTLRLAHGWTLGLDPGAEWQLVREYLRPAVRAVPSTMAQRLGPCRIILTAAAPGVTSRWSLTDSALEIVVVTEEVESHDVAMELLLCLGQVLWEKLADGECRAYAQLLQEEIGKGIEGEIDEQALEEKRSLFESQCHATRVRRLSHYARASFAGTAAEYVHCLWHEVTVRTGPDYLPAPQLRRRLEMFSRWFPPDRGHCLFPSGSRAKRLPSSTGASRRCCK